MRGVGFLLMLPSLADASGQEYHQVAKSPCHLLRPHTPPSSSSHSIFLVLTLHLQHSPFHLPRPYTPSSPFSIPSSIAGHPVRSSLFVMHVSAASLCDRDAISATRGRMMPPVITAHHGPLALLSELPWQKSHWPPRDGLASVVSPSATSWSFVMRCMYDCMIPFSRLTSVSTLTSCMIFFRRRGSLW